MSVVALLALDGMPAHQLSTPGMVLAAARDSARVDYELRVCAPSATVTTGAPGLLTVTVPWSLAGLADATAVIVPGHAGAADGPSSEVAAALRAAVDRGARLLGVGAGTLALAATGLLDGRRASTAWEHVGDLAARHPGVTVEPEGAVVADGPFLTGAGFYGGMDLVLRLVEQDHGPRAVAATVRHLLRPLLDEAHAAQEEIDRGIAETAGLEPTVRWLDANPHLPLTLADIAAHARLSIRSLNRRFRDHTGHSPLRYLLRTRLERARRLLEETDETVERVAERAGFSSPESLRRHVRRATGVVPRAYRTAYRAGRTPLSSLGGGRGGTGDE
ncbi:GlxA family transcriptional regulator [Streptomyces sp. NPDC057702]|uniref:GlxA family transcriptional regulator n=1 Tax=unclassified Streptomyces TaxID=2593676 RepID=UPI0036C01B84